MGSPTRGGRIFSARPDLGLLIAETVASWSRVESVMLELFVGLMGGRKDNAATVFLALEIQSAKSVAINAVADTVLSNDHKKLLRVILAIARTNQKTRDKIVHGNWGFATNIQDGLLLEDPRAQYKSQESSIPDLQLPSTLPGETRAKIERMINKSDTGKTTHDDILVYKAKDFDDAILQNNRLCGYCIDFGIMNDVAEINPRLAQKLYDQLCAVPEIQERLDRPASPEQSLQGGFGAFPP